MGGYAGTFVGLGVGMPELLGALAGIESDTGLTGYLRSQDPAPHKSVQRRISLTALQFKPELYGTTTLCLHRPFWGL